MLYFLAPLVFSTILGPILCLAVARRRDLPGSGALFALIAAATLWSAGYALEIYLPGWSAKVFWGKFQYFGIVLVPLGWAGFAVQYLGVPKLLSRLHPLRYLLLVIPAVTLLLVWTNERHGLIWQAVHLDWVAGVWMADFDHGPWFWVFWIYSLAMSFTGSAWLVLQARRSTRLLTWQIRLILAGAMLPWISNLMYVAHLNPIPDLDWTPFSFSIAGLLFTLSMLRFYFVRLVPVAQRAVFEDLADGVLVLDLHNRVVDANPSAERLTGLSGEDMLGKPLEWILPALNRPDIRLDDDPTASREIPLYSAAGRSIYELRRAPLNNASGVMIGRMATLHDITERKQAQELLEKAYDELEERVSARTADLQRLNFQLEAELARRILAEGRFADLVNSAPDAILLLDSQGRVILANAQAETTFGWSCDDFAALSLNELVPLGAQLEHHEKLGSYFNHPMDQQHNPLARVHGLRKGGQEFPAEVYLRTLKTAEGVLLACIVRDITLREQAEQEQAALLDELRESHAEVRAMAATLEDSRMQERRQIAAELHDQVGQGLTALNLNLTAIQNRLLPAEPDPVQRRLADSLRLVEETTRQVRNVMAELNPPLLDEYGLVAALQWYLSQFSERTGIAVRLSGDETVGDLTPRVGFTLYRIVQEALNNAAKHSGASQARVRLKQACGCLTLRVVDNGRGFDPVARNGGQERAHWGLFIMKERVASIGGQVEIVSWPGQGAAVIVTLGGAPQDGSSLLDGDGRTLGRGAV